VRLDDIKTLVDIVNSIIATLAIIAAGWWFLLSRSLAGTLQITLSLTGVNMVNTTQIVTVKVQIKNVGRTRIKKDYSAIAVKGLNIRPSSEPIHIIEPGLFDYSQGREIFRSLTEIEPNEETYQDVAFALDGIALLAVGVRLKRKRTHEAWQATAIFSTDDKVLRAAQPLDK
jgi:hypothetical protein